MSPLPALYFTIRDSFVWLRMSLIFSCEMQVSGCGRQPCVIKDQPLCGLHLADTVPQSGAPSAETKGAAPWVGGSPWSVQNIESNRRLQGQWRNLLQVGASLLFCQQNRAAELTEPGTPQSCPSAFAPRHLHGPRLPRLPREPRSADRRSQPTWLQLCVSVSTVSQITAAEPTGRVSSGRRRAGCLQC